VPDVAKRAKLPSWAWVLIVAVILGGLFMLAITAIFLWPWVMAFF
jgi:hypothetical protein